LSAAAIVGVLAGSAGVELVAIEEAVLVAVDADALAGSGRDAEVRARLAARRLRAELRVRVALRETIALEDAVREPPSPRFAGERPLDDDVALANRRAIEEERRARLRVAAARRPERHLLAHDRRQVGVECEDELLDLTSQGVAGRAVGEAAGIDAGNPEDRLVEHEGVVEAEDGVDAAVV
jgi:hypothetical protein